MTPTDGCQSGRMGRPAKALPSNRGAEGSNPSPSALSPRSMLAMRRLSLWSEQAQTECDVAVYSYVYFIAAGDYMKDGTPIKIGYSGTDPVRRLATLQQAHYAKLALVLAVPGDRALEGRLHDSLKDHRIRGEWFRSSQELRTLIATLGNDPSEALADLRRERVDFLATFSEYDSKGANPRSLKPQENSGFADIFEGEA